MYSLQRFMAQIRNHRVYLILYNEIDYKLIRFSLTAECWLQCLCGCYYSKKLKVKMVPIHRHLCKLTFLANNIGYDWCNTYIVTPRLNNLKKVVIMKWKWFVLRSVYTKIITNNIFNSWETIYSTLGKCLTIKSLPTNEMKFTNTNSLIWKDCDEITKKLPIASCVYKENRMKIARCIMFNV